MKFSLTVRGTERVLNENRTTIRGPMAQPVTCRVTQMGWRVSG